jgi:cell division protein FtsW
VSTTTTRRVAPPLEHRILVTATLCLLAFGAVMVYSASSPLGVVNGHGYGTSEFLMYVLAGGIGLVAMRLCERHGLTLFSREFVTVLLLGSFALLVAVLVPGIGVEVNSARRWIGAGPIQFQPSELMKLALVLYAARYLADNPRRLHRGFKEAIAPLAVVAVPACALIYAEPDLGTTLVVCLTVAMLMVAAGMPSRYLAILAGIAFCAVALLVLGSAYQRARLLSFLQPSQCAQTTCFQSSQGQIAVGSGGLFGVGLGQSVGKIGYVPEAQTDFILAVIGDELGLAGIFSVLLLYGLIAFAGLRTARRAKSPYEKLLATGLTSLILCQGILNIFVVLGIAPLTGVPLPFISYAPTNLCVMLVSVGLLLNIARPSARSLRALDGRRAAAPGDSTADRDRRRGDGRPRGAGARGGRRAAG